MKEQSNNSESPKDSYTFEHKCLKCDRDTLTMIYNSEVIKHSYMSHIYQCGSCNTKFKVSTQFGDNAFLVHILITECKMCDNGVCCQGNNIDCEHDCTWDKAL